MARFKYQYASPPRLEQSVEKHGVGRIFVVLFWIHQLLLGIPSTVLGLQFVTQGKADGILNVIGLLLAWIGGTLCWGFAVVIHDKYRLKPAIPTVRLADEQKHPVQSRSEFTQTYKGFPYRELDGQIEVITTEGLRTYRDMNEFRRAVE